MPSGAAGEAGRPGCRAWGAEPGRRAGVASVSCTSAGNRAAAGDYRAAGCQQGFVVSEVNGVWGQAAGVPGLDA